MVKFKSVEKLPRQISPKPSVMRKIRMAVRRALRPISRVMNFDDPGRAAYANKSAEIEEAISNPWDRTEAAMNHHAVHPNRVTKKKCDISQTQAKAYCGEVCKKWR